MTNPARDARLSAIRIMDGGAGTPVTLSTAFQPTVTSYGAVVASNTSDVTLCLQVRQASSWRIGILQHRRAAAHALIVLF
jgi:hypothetical protein